MVAVVQLVATGEPASLADAAKNGDRALVRTLLQQRVDVNAPQPDGMTALHWAAQRNDVETADALIAAGAKVEAVTRYGVTPLSLAAQNGSTAMIDRLIKAGADPNWRTPDGETALMTVARTGSVVALRLLLINGADVNATETWKGQTPLMWASGEGHGEVVRMLIEAGARVNDRSKAGFTPLLFAVREGHIDATEALLAAGANPNDIVRTTATEVYAQPRTEVPTSALVMAIINAHYELASVLLKHGADPNIGDVRGSALHALTWMRRPGRIGAAGGVIGAVREPTGRLDSLDLAKDLLARGANPNARINWKEIRFDRDDAEARLPPNIAVGRSYISQVGATPFFLAARHGDVELMRLLATHGANPLTPTVQNVTPLMAAAGLGYWDGETPGPLGGTPESERLEAVKLALELGGEVNASADFGDFPLEGDGVALLWGFPKNLEKLPDAALGDMRWNGSTALHGAALLEQPSIIKFLVERGARLDARNKIGWTPLMVAEGLLVAATQKDMPISEAAIRELMTAKGMDPALYSQRDAGGANASTRQATR
jgi:ankyrin repeat protein